MCNHAIYAISSGSVLAQQKLEYKEYVHSLISFLSFSFVSFSRKVLL